MFSRNTVLVVVAAFMALITGACGMADDNLEQQEAVPIYFEQGSDPGKLFYESDPMGVPTLPIGVAVDGDGNCYFLEPELQRVQQFTADGEFVGELPPSEAIAEAPESYPSGLAVDETGLVCVLWATPSAEDGTLTLELCRYSAGGELKAQTALIEAPVKLTQVERMWIDSRGFIWLREGNLGLAFTRDGYFNAKVEGNIVGFTPMGYLLVRRDSLALYNCNGTLEINLESVTAEYPATVVAGDLKGLLVALPARQKESQVDATLEAENKIELFRFDAEAATVTSLGRMELPVTRFVYPIPESDNAVAEQVYLTELATLSNGRLYVLAYSEEDFWLESFDLSQYQK